VLLVEQELLTIPANLSSFPVFSGVWVTRSLILCACFVNRCIDVWYPVVLQSPIVPKSKPLCFFSKLALCPEYAEKIFIKYLINYQDSLLSSDVKVESSTYWLLRISFSMSRLLLFVTIKNSRHKINRLGDIGSFCLSPRCNL
jgi:hypothetical protein